MCKRCNPKHFEDDKYSRLAIIKINGVDVAGLYMYADEAVLAVHTDIKDKYKAVRIEYCPFCGKKLNND